jgi:uncharacterized membrane protein HdeD (DUF308 family)
MSSSTQATHWWTIMLRAGFTILFGTLALQDPAISLMSFSVALSAVMIVDGVVALAKTMSRRRVTGEPLRSSTDPPPR